MKTTKVENTSADLKVWCEVCCIRIAPSEKRTVTQGKTYHLSCYVKLTAKTPNRA